MTGLTTFGKNKRNNSSDQLEIETSLMLAEIKTLKNLQLRIYIYRHIRTWTFIRTLHLFAYIFAFYKNSKNKKCLWTEVQTIPSCIQLNEHALTPNSLFLRIISVNTWCLILQGFVYILWIYSFCCRRLLFYKNGHSLHGLSIWRDNLPFCSRMAWASLLPC